MQVRVGHGAIMSREGGDGAEEALSSREQELGLLVETIPALVWRAGPEGNVEFAAQLQATLDVIPAYAWYAAPSGGLTFVNKRTADYLGLAKDHPLRFGIDTGAQWDAHIPLLHPDDREESRKAWSTCLRTGEAAEFSQRVRNAQGGYHWFLSRVEPLRASDGTLLQWVGVNLDIEELKCAEQALRESERKFRDYAETASDWFWEIGPDYKFTMLTENAFGSHSADRIGTACWDHALDLETEPEKWRLVRDTLDARKLFRDLVYCSVDGNGLPIYVKASGKPVFDANGEFRGYRGTASDVTERKRADEALRESAEALRHSEAYLAEAQRLSHTGSFCVAAAVGPEAFLSSEVDRRTLVYWSEENYRIWGLDPLLGLPRRETLWQRIHPDDRDRVTEETQGAMRQKRDYMVEFRIVLPDGTIKHLESTGHHLFSPSGDIVEIVGTHVDVTERKRAQEEHERLRQLEADLAHMNRVSMMGELAASLAHEITQPIASARNNARAALNFLDQRPADFGEVREAIDCVVGDSDRAGDIIDRIREHIKKVPPRKGRFDLNAAINEVIVLARSVISENGVSVRTGLADRLFAVQGDRVQVQQVLLNLVLNAVEAMGSLEPGARELVINTEQTSTGGVLVAVRDSGPGIDPEHLERVFKAFYTTKSSGVGMGLSICRSIIDAHGGRLWAEANEPRGAVFQFTLPGAKGEFTASHRT
jgi:PAS domain S-box-containing protein